MTRRNRDTLAPLSERAHAVWPRGATFRPPFTALRQLHQAILGCTRCVDAGYLSRAAPVFSGSADNRIMLIGQAPGLVEASRRLPFQGRSRTALMQWLQRAGLGSEADVRRHVYMTSVTKCFPGKGAGGGDRRPRQAEVNLCRSHLDRQLALIRPDVILLVGGLAHEQFLPGRPLGRLVGGVFDVNGRRLARADRVSPVLIPLPHPSGASRWLNARANRLLLDKALRRAALVISAHRAVT
jgi:uracil-DNA glycosylase